MLEFISLCYFIFYAFPLNILPTEKFNGITYSPYTNEGTCKTSETINKDLVLLSKHTKNIRLFGQDCNQTEVALNFCKKNTGPKFLFGIWTKNDRFTSEISYLYKTIFEKKDLFEKCVSGIVVGEEDFNDGIESQIKLIEYIKVTKEITNSLGTKVKIIANEIPKHWNNNLMESVDVIGLSIQPYFGYDNNDMNSASFDVLNQYQSIKNKTQKSVIITEVGWPSNGANEFGATPSTHSQDQFIKNLFCQLEKFKIEYFLFEAFDSNWKTNQRLIEQNFGIFANSNNSLPKIKLPPYECN